MAFDSSEKSKVFSEIECLDYTEAKHYFAFQLARGNPL